MDLRQLANFVVIADTKSFTRAAVHIGVTQPALSRQIKELEVELGAALVERHVRGLEMTDAGKVLYGRATKILELANSVKEEIAAVMTEPAGDLVVAMPASFRSLITEKIIYEYKSLYPKVRLCILELTTTERRDAVMEGYANLGITTTMDPQEGLRTRPLVNEALFVAGSRSHGFSLSSPESLEKIASLPLIQNTQPNAMRIIVDAAFARAGLQSRADIEVDAIDMMIDLASKGHYCIIAPYSAIHRHLNRNTITAAPVTNLSVTWQAVVSGSSYVSLSTKIFEKMLVNECRNLIMQGVWKTGKMLYPDII